MSRRVLILVVLAIAVAGGAVFVASGGSAPGTGGSPSPTLPPVPPSTTVSADARIVPLRSVELLAPGSGGVVAEVLVAEGDRVAADAALLRLDTTFADADVTQAEAALATATAGAAQAAAAARQADDQVAAAEAQVDLAEAAVTVADATRDGLPGSASNAQERAANAEVVRASAALRAARAQRDAARDGRAAAREAANGATADVTRARSVLEAATAARDDLTLRAPFAGTVASLDAVIGETVGGALPVVRVADVSAWRIETTDLDEASVARVPDGATATVTVDALPDAPFEARVVSIAPFGELAAGDVVYRVVLEPAGDAPEGLRWNMTASVTIEVGETG